MVLYHTTRVNQYSCIITFVSLGWKVSGARRHEFPGSVPPLPAQAEAHFYLDSAGGLCSAALAYASRRLAGRGSRRNPPPEPDYAAISWSTASSASTLAADDRRSFSSRSMIFPTFVLGFLKLS